VDLGLVFMRNPAQDVEDPLSRSVRGRLTLMTSTVGWRVYLSNGRVPRGFGRGPRGGRVSQPSADNVAVSWADCGWAWRSAAAGVGSPLPRVCCPGRLAAGRTYPICGPFFMARRWRRITSFLGRSAAAIRLGSPPKLGVRNSGGRWCRGASNRRERLAVSSGTIVLCRHSIKASACFVWLGGVICFLCLCFSSARLVGRCPWSWRSMRTNGGDYFPHLPWSWPKHRSPGFGSRFDGVGNLDRPAVEADLPANRGWPTGLADGPGSARASAGTGLAPKPTPLNAPFRAGPSDDETAPSHVPMPG